MDDQKEFERLPQHVKKSLEEGAAVAAEHLRKAIDEDILKTWLREAENAVRQAEESSNQLIVVKGRQLGRNTLYYLEQHKDGGENG